MHLVKISFLVAAVLLFSSYSVSAQSEVKPWTVECVAGVSKGDKIPCSNVNASGNNYTFYLEMLINSDQKTARASLTFTRKIEDKTRSIKIIEVLPSRDESNENQEYWFIGKTNGPDGRGKNLYLANFTFQGYNKNNKNNGYNGYVAPGDYTGTFKVQDTISGEIFNITLNVKVIKIEPKK